MALPTHHSSTPHISRVSASSTTDRKSEVPLLQGELDDHIAEDMNFRLFIREACKLPDATYQTIQTAMESGNFGPAAEWTRLLKSLSDVPLGHETQLYAPLIQLYNWVCGRLARLGLRSSTGLGFKDTSTTPLDDSPARRKPDLTGVSEPIPEQTPSWKDVLVCWEVKHQRKRSAQVQLEEPATKKLKTSRGAKPSNELSKDDDRDSPLSALEQLASYLLETISAQPHRRHTFGVLLCEWELQLVLHSRSFIVATEPFDIRYDPIKLAVAMAALWVADLRTLGFDPHFIDADERSVVRTDGCHVIINGRTYDIARTLYRGRSLFGRGTASLDGALGTVRVVIKINCPPKTREVEAELLKRAQDIPNIIKVTSSDTWGDTLQGFGPNFIEAVMRFEVREFRVLVLSPLCEPFTSIGELDEFKRCFRKLVVAHNELYKINILHCDISIWNMMYDPVGREPYLIDADLGKSTNKLISPSSNHRTGTLPFMAAQLLVKTPPPHMYHHDLESFFYVLAWRCTQDHCGWHTIYSVSAMRKDKNDFLTISRGGPIGALKLWPQFEPLRETWIRKLHHLLVRRKTRETLLDLGLSKEAENLKLGNVYSDFLEVLDESN